MWCTVALLLPFLLPVPCDDYAFFKQLSPGDRVTLGDKDATVVGSEAYVFYRRLIELAAANDRDGVDEMVRKKQATYLDGGNDARVIKRGTDYVEARLLSGPAKGKSLYVHRYYVKKP